VLEQLPWRCYTSNFVLDETFTLLARRASYAFAAQRARNILTSTTLTILRPDPVDELDALHLTDTVCL
jgi:predicted nucleic acid-binding protein